jgi:hypothetical protein
MFENVAPAAPEEALRALEDGLVGTNDSKMLWNCRTYVNVLRSLAYDAGLFSRCVALLARIAIACDVNENSNRALDALASLFQICYSGTHTPIDRRLEWIRTLLDCHSTESNKLVLKALEATLEAWQFRPFHDFEFGARSRDYGYWPRSEEEVRHWFGLALKLSKELACSNEPIAAGVRQILTEQLRGLWNRAGTYDEIEETFCAISQAQFWPGGWLAIRQVRHFDGKGLRPDISARLSSLEAALKPTNIAQNVRSIVLSEDIAGSYITDTDDENLTAAMARTAGIAYELGKSVAGDDGLVGELLPELVRTQGERVWRFGQGLARASSDPRTLWDRLVGAFAATAKGHERFQVLCGFMEELHAVAPAITDELLDSALQDKRVASVFPALQGAAGIDKRGLERLRSGLRSGLIPVGNFRLLIAGGACDAIPENELTSMILQIASAPGGFEAAAEILHMRLHRDVNTNRMPSDEMMSLGRELLRQTTFTRDHDIRRDYCLGQLCRTCLGGDEGAAVARGICRRLKAAVSGYTAYVFENDDLIAGLFTKHPTLALDELCGGNSNELDKGVHMLHSLRQNPLDSIPENELFVWCDNEPATRYPAVASAMTAYTGKHVNEPKHWTARALHLLERAADRVDICRRYVAQIEITWHTPMLEQLVKLLDEVHIPSDAALVNFVAKEKARLRDLVEARRLAEGTACRVQNERFE